MIGSRPLVLHTTPARLGLAAERPNLRAGLPRRPLLGECCTEAQGGRRRRRIAASFSGCDTGTVTGETRGSLPRDWKSRFHLAGSCKAKTASTSREIYRTPDSSAADPGVGNGVSARHCIPLKWPCRRCEDYTTKRRVVSSLGCTGRRNRVDEGRHRGPSWNDRPRWKCIQEISGHTSRRVERRSERTTSSLRSKPRGSFRSDQARIWAGRIERDCQACCTRQPHPRPNQSIAAQNNRHSLIYQCKTSAQGFALHNLPPTLCTYAGLFMAIFGLLRRSSRPHQRGAVQ